MKLQFLGALLPDVLFLLVLSWLAGKVVSTTSSYANKPSRWLGSTLHRTQIQMRTWLSSERHFIKILLSKQRASQRRYYNHLQPEMMLHRPSHNSYKWTTSCWWSSCAHWHRRSQQVYLRHMLPSRTLTPQLWQLPQKWWWHHCAMALLCNSKKTWKPQQHYSWVHTMALYLLVKIFKITGSV